MTGLADQLQHEGWLVREAVEHDRRATRLRLTDAGASASPAWARTHEGWVVEMLGALSRDEQRQLLALLGKLKLGLRPAGAGPADDAGPGHTPRPAPGPREARSTPPASGARRPARAPRAGRARRPPRPIPHKVRP